MAELKNAISNRELTQLQMENDNMRIRISAKAVREHLGMSKEDFAESLDVSSRLISYLECGERAWSDDLLNKLTAVFP